MSKSKHPDNNTDLYAELANILARQFLIASGYRVTINNWKMPESLDIDYNKPLEWNKQPIPCLVLVLLAFFLIGLLAIPFVIPSMGTRSEQITQLIGALSIPFITASLFVWRVRTYNKSNSTWQVQYKAAIKPRAELDITCAKMYGISVRPDTDWNPEQAGKFMEQLLRRTRGVTLQIVASNGNLEWRIVDLKDELNETIIQSTVSAFYPDAIIKPVQPLVSDQSEFFRTVFVLKQAGHFILPITRIGDLIKTDPLLNLANEATRVTAGERFEFTIFIADIAEFLYEPPNLELAPRDVELLNEKLSNLCCQVIVGIQIDAQTRDRVIELAAISDHTGQFSNKQNSLSIYEGIGEIWRVDNAKRDVESTIFSHYEKWLTNKDMEWEQFRMILDAQEIAALWHLPDVRFPKTNIVWVNNPQPSKEDALVSLPLSQAEEDQDTIPNTEKFSLDQLRAYLGRNKIFISYAHVDKWQINQLVETLRDGGYEPWFDHSLVPGKDWKMQLLAAIEECGIFLYAMTPESLNSDWCRWEFAKAAEINKPIIPVRMQYNLELPDDVKKLQWVDFSEGPTGRAIAKLFHGLREATTLDISDLSIIPIEPNGVPSRAVQSTDK